MDVSTAVRSLRATRTYLPTPITSSEVEAWIDTVRWCGSSKNSQPWRFIVVQDRNLLAHLATMGDHASHLNEAPTAVAVAMRATEFPFSTQLDLGRVVQSLMLVAHAKGVASCIAVFEPPDNVRAAAALLGVPPDFALDLAIAFGHPDPSASPDSADVAISPSGRLPTSDLLSWGTFRSGSAPA